MGENVTLSGHPSAPYCLTPPTLGMELRMFNISNINTLTGVARSGIEPQAPDMK